jgi:hypothetical protein
MRKLLLLSTIAVAMCFCLAPEARAECTCETLAYHNVTCLKCGNMVQVATCSSLSGTGCQACQEFAQSVLCCAPDESVGSAEYCGSCGEKCGQALNVPGASIHRVYQTGCTGGITPTMVALR